MIGSGFVGVVSGACFAEFSANFTCIDVDSAKIDNLKAGKMPIYEPGLDDLATFERIVREVNPVADFDVASNPEFLREGVVIGEFLRMDRVVLVVESERADKLLRELYRPINLIETTTMVNDRKSAELVKYASNAFLATKISFINMVSFVCAQVGADVHVVAKGMSLDNRIGRKFLHAGPGYGGPYFPKDTTALIRIAQERGASCCIVEAAVEVNAAQKARIVKKIREALGGSEAGKTIAVLGLTFKPETEDMRDSPSLAFIPNLVDKGATIHAHDPQGMEEAKKLLPEKVQYFDDVYEMLGGQMRAC